MASFFFFFTVAFIAFIAFMAFMRRRFTNLPAFFFSGRRAPKIRTNLPASIFGCKALTWRRRRRPCRKRWPSRCKFSDQLVVDLVQLLLEPHKGVLRMAT